MQTIPTLAHNLVTARIAAKEAKARFHAVSRESGPCYMAADKKCYHKGIPEDQWCQSCQAKQPAWRDYRAKITAASSSLRKLLNAAKKLQE